MRNCPKNYFCKKVIFNSNFFLSKWFLKLRLDFETFVISGPSTGSDTDAVDGACKNGVFTSPSPATCSLASQCLTDSFSITNPGGSAPPTICGTNTGKHSMRLC